MLNEFLNASNLEFRTINANFHNKIDSTFAFFIIY